MDNDTILTSNLEKLSRASERLRAARLAFAGAIDAYRELSVWGNYNDGLDEAFDVLKAKHEQVEADIRETKRKLNHERYIVG